MSGTAASPSEAKPINPLLKLALEFGPLAIFFFANSYGDRWFGGMTRSGQMLRKGIVAVDPALIPLGTKLYIPGYGFAVAADTGGGIKGNMIDLGYPDGVPADWRTGWVDIYILGN